MSEAWIDALYRERAHLLAFLTTVYPSHIQFQADPDAPGWPVLYVSLPTGQASWHIAETDMDLFEHVRTDVVESWDGHTTDEKLDRLNRATRMREAA